MKNVLFSKDDSTIVHINNIVNTGYIVAKINTDEPKECFLLINYGTDGYNWISLNNCKDIEDPYEMFVTRKDACNALNTDYDVEIYWVETYKEFITFLGQAV